MNPTLKKAIALLLAAVMLSGLSAVAFAKSTQWISQSMSDIPVIRISGDGEKLYDEDGNKVIYYRDIPSVLASDDEDEDGDDSTMRSVANVMMPFLINGMLLNDWDPYYENLQKEVGELFERSLLDKDGNPQYGTGISPEKAAKTSSEEASENHCVSEMPVTEATSCASSSVAARSRASIFSSSESPA